jgi:hypothetical protein
MLEKPLIKYLDFVRGWLNGRDMNDPYNEFYVSFTPSTSTNSIEQFGLKKAKNTMVPTFMKDVANEVFLTGRFIRTLYCFVKETDRQRISEELDIDGKFMKLQNIITSFNQTNKPKEYNGFFKRMKNISLSKKLEKQLPKVSSHFNQN